MQIIKTINPILILRIGGGFCFIGHGVLALTPKVHFLELLSSFGVDEVNAIPILKIIGLLDILIGLLILFKPHKRVLQWAMLWTSLTIIAWGFHGDTLMDLFRRLTYFTTPFALLLLIYSSKNTKESNSDIKPPEPIIQDENTSRILEAEKAINGIDLSMIGLKLMSKTHGEGWSKQQCVEVAQEYRRYLKLNLLYPMETIVPNVAIDTMWHYHILDTAAYQQDCETIFGRMLHHYPYLGMKGVEDTKEFVNSFDRTKELYKKTFTTSMDDENYLPSF